MIPNIPSTHLPSVHTSRSPVLADLPGLIEGAHVGRGLGRMFLRHLKRTRVLLQVIDASSPNVESDYWVVREELRMYNPEYTQRPHVVALNKIDLVEDAERLDVSSNACLRRYTPSSSFVN